MDGDGVTYNNKPALGSSLGGTAQRPRHMERGQCDRRCDGQRHVRLHPDDQQCQALSLASRTAPAAATRRSSRYRERNQHAAAKRRPRRPGRRSGHGNADGVPANCTAVNLDQGPDPDPDGSNTSMRSLAVVANTTFTVKWGTTTAYSTGTASITVYDTTNHLYSYTITGLTPGTKNDYPGDRGSHAPGAHSTLRPMPRQPT